MLARKQFRACDGAGRLARPLHSSLCVGLLAIALAATSACLGPRGGAPSGDAAGAAGAAGAGAGAADASALAIIRDDVALPLSLLIGQVPQDVESLLGEPLTKGMRRGSCVRFVPERVFYSCEHVEQTYADKTGTFARVRVEFDDGVATRVAFDGTPGEGPFTPEQALAAVGLTLPEPGRRSEPAAGVELWSWFNGQARLRIHDREHRVEVSVVNGDRTRSRVDVIDNHPLSDAQKAKVVAAKPKNAPAVGSAPPATP